MDKSLLTSQRRILKKSIYRSRVEWTLNGYLPLCAICEEPEYTGAMEMHEAILTRGDVQGNPELLPLIMTEYNCVLVHKICHTTANTKKGLRACIKHILKYEKYKNVILWLEEMQSKMISSIPEEAIQLVKEVNNEL